NYEACQRAPPPNRGHEGFLAGRVNWERMRGKSIQSRAHCGQELSPARLFKVQSFARPQNAPLECPPLRTSARTPLPEWFFTSDLHGQGALYEQLVALVAARRPQAVLIGGDLCPHAVGAEGIAYQRVFLQGTLVEFARRLREASS